MTKLVWLTDLHLVEPGQDWPQGIDPLAGLRACLDEIRVQHADAARVVISGDLIQLRNPRAYSTLRRELAQMPMPYRLLVGNHDDRSALLATFPEIVPVGGFIQSAEDVDCARLLYLDTLASDRSHHGELCSARVTWIAGQIHASRERPLLIFMHHPPCDIGVPALDRLRLLGNEELAGLLRKRSAPTQLFCGHVHRNASGLWAGHSFATLKSPHVQFELDMIGQKLVRSKEPPGYGVILLSKSDVAVNYRDIPVAT
jgi:3',5'-cyclic-AMP phosphodiesterase